MGQQRDEPTPFADLVQAAKSNAEVEQEGVHPWPLPIRDGHWTDHDGVRWHIRGRRGGGTLPPDSVLRRLLKLTNLRILHAYGPRPTEVSGPEREALLERVDRYLAGGTPPHNEFRLAEFRNDDRQVMLVVEEFC